jgi:hypothetical protein
MLDRYDSQMKSLNSEAYETAKQKLDEAKEEAEKLNAIKPRYCP